MASKIQLRRGLSTQWAASNPTLAAGEIGIETDTQQLKIGNGSTAWNSLPYIATGNMDVAGSDLDDLADGTTYKRILAAIATALNAGTYDAAKCTAFGIGTAAPSAVTTEAGLDAITGGGLYKFSSDTAGPFPGGGVTILALPYSAGAFSLIAIQNAGGIKYRYTGEAAWKTFWTSFSDGNGGQPPAPKPTTTGIGKWIQYTGQYVGGSALETGTFAVIPIDTNGHFTPTLFGAAVLAGGTDMGAATAYHVGWKIAF